MHGFSVYISIDKPVSKVNFTWKPLFSFQGKHCLRRFESTQIAIEQYTAEKFIQDKLWIDNEDFFILTDGVVTNLKSLREAYKVNSNEELISIISSKADFFNEFTGHFAGFIWYKNSNEFIAFNNHCGTKKVFYYADERIVLFSTDLFTLSRLLDNLNIAKSLDLDAAYLLLTSGFMHEDYTLIKQVKQLRAGEYASFSNKKLQINSYFHLSNINQNKDSEAEIITKLDELFTKSVKLEFDQDKSTNLTAITTLSGGLDSRMVALTAHESGYNNQIFLNFSEKDYADEIIAKQIADKYRVDMFQIPLSAQGLCSIDEVVRVNDGLTLYTGAGHVFEALQNLDSLNDITNESTGFIHTGILGDAILGSYLNAKTICKPLTTDGLYSRGLFIKAENTLQKSVDNYPTEELYKLYNRAFLGVNNGFLYFDLIGESSSPFLHPEFISYVYSIPRSFKFKEKIYIDWIKKLHPEFAKFTWESIGGKPTNNNFLRQYYRYKRAIIKRLPLKSMWKNNMNPEQLWYDNNALVKKTLDDYFAININLIAGESELKTDLISLYQTGNITEKTQALTLLGAIKLLF